VRIARARGRQVGLLGGLEDAPLQQVREAPQREDAQLAGLTGERGHLLQVRDLGLAPPRARERGQDPGLVVEDVEDGRHRVARPAPVEVVEQ
jgi:hypothetical protein